MEDTSSSTEEGSSSALNASSSNVTRTRGSNSFSPTELGGTLAAGESPSQSSGGVVDALLQCTPVALGGRTPGGTRAEAKDGNALSVAASRVAVERAVAGDKPPQQRLAENGPSESAKSLLADLNA